MKNLPFEAWYAQVDAHVQALAGLSRDDLPDQPYADWHEDGLSPRAAAKAAIRRADGEE